MKLLPTKKYEYPLFMAGYWLFLWVVIAVVIYIHVLEGSTNGQVFKRDCLRKTNNVCTLTSRKYAVPVGLEAGTQILTIGIGIGFFIIVGGFSQMLLKKK